MAASHEARALKQVVDDEHQDREACEASQRAHATVVSCQERLNRETEVAAQAYALSEAMKTTLGESREELQRTQLANSAAVSAEKTAKHTMHEAGRAAVEAMEAATLDVKYNGGPCIN